MHAGLLETVAQRMRMYVLRARVTLRPGPPVYGLAADHDAARRAGRPAARRRSRCRRPARGASASLRLPGRAGWLVAGDPGRGRAPRPTPRPRRVGARRNRGGHCPRSTRRPAASSSRRCSTSTGIGAVSFTKGCYPGQEIVARAHHLGRVKRRARCFARRAPPPARRALAEAARHRGARRVRPTTAACCWRSCPRTQRDRSRWPTAGRCTAPPP
jgi:tRNA-modifying protein YgfZ